MRLTRRQAVMAGALVLTAGGAVGLSPVLAAALEDDKRRHAVDTTARPLFDGWRHVRVTGPDRSLVYDPDARLVATLTDGARTAVFSGPQRRFAEPHSTRAHLDSTSWVLLGPAAWKPDLAAYSGFQSWFRTAVADVASAAAAARDALTVAMQYVAGAPVETDPHGVEYAGDAGFGPMRHGHRLNQADYYDYLGIPVTWPDGTTSQPDPELYRYVDCSGFQRLVWGYRLGMRTTDGAAIPGVAALPRFARQLAVYPPTTVLFDAVDKAPDQDALARLQPGDLVFLAQEADPRYISHCGMVMGEDTDGHLRFISSRAVVNGPSIGDNNKLGILDGAGYYAHRLRRAIRL